MADVSNHPSSKYLGVLLMDVKGKTAIVLGGTSGIGLATTTRLIELGAKGIAVSRYPDKAKGIITSGVELPFFHVLD